MKRKNDYKTLILRDKKGHNGGLSAVLRAFDFSSHTQSETQTKTSFIVETLLLPPGIRPLG